MLISFGIEIIALGSLIVLGCFAALVLLTRKDNASPNKFLSIFLLTVSLWLIDSFLRLSGIYQQDPDYYFLPIYYSLAFGPLIYFYVRSLTNPHFQFSRKQLWHFTPVLIQALLYLFLNLKEYSFKRWYWLEVHQPYTYRIEFDGTFLSLAIYLYGSIQLIKSYQRRLEDNYSDTHKIRLHWLRGLLIILFILCIAWFVEVIFRDYYHNYYQFNYTSLILGILTLVLAYGAMTQPNLTAVELEKENIEDATQVPIDDDTKNIIRAQMTTHRAYLDSALSLNAFALQCGLPVRKISQGINQGFSMSFHDYINQHRVEAVKEQLKTADLEIYTIQGIAMDCGFNSKATFNRIFKTFTGITPTQYVKKLNLS
ncbi:MAG: AraC-like DNA-binding protein [Saprospiraceae bacterium]|jgi:AraC-like DNA-binding protein